MAPQIPQPDYEYNVAQLVAYYRRALADIQRELDRLDLTDTRRAHMLAVQREIAKLLKELDKKATEWVEQNIPIAVEDGIIRTLVALELVANTDEARKVVAFNRLNRDLIATAVADTQADLLAITQNVDRKLRTAIRQAMALSVRTNMTQGINGVRTIQRDFLAEARAILGDALNTGIIDAANRRWKPTVYAEMVARTKMMRTHEEATVNEAVSRGALYGVISRHGATDACRNWEGRIVKLVAGAPGDYPYVGSLPRREIFHPNCRHQILPLRDPDRLNN